jgi:hypothetical protein
MKDGLRRRILALGPAAIPELAALLTEPELLDRYAQHGAALLAALDQAGHEALIEALTTIERNTRAFDIVVQTLVKLGPSIAPRIETTLNTGAPDLLTDSLLEILSRCGARSESSLARLLTAFELEPGRFAAFLADYGDPAALPALQRHFGQTPLSSHEQHLGNTTVKEIGEAILSLNGSLSTEGQHKLQTATALLKHQQHDLTFDFRESE